MSVELLKERTDLSVDELKQLMDEETDVKRYKKLHFLQLKEEGYTIKEAYNLANLKKTLAYLTLKQWQAGGYNALIRKPGGGRSVKLNNNQLEELEKKILSQKFISTEEVQDFIKKNWDVDYTITGIKNLLKSQFNITLNQNKESINELTDRLEKHLKNVESRMSDDNELNREITKELLKIEGYKFEEASNGKEALDLIINKNKCFDLILMDIQMPIMDGFECVKNIRNKKNLNMPIIAMTANAFDEQKNNILNNGFDNYISKPINFEKLINMIKGYTS